jgi:hypothetical protein
MTTSIKISALQATLDMIDLTLLLKKIKLGNSMASQDTLFDPSHSRNSQIEKGFHTGGALGVCIWHTPVSKGYFMGSYYVRF